MVSRVDQSLAAGAGADDVGAPSSPIALPSMPDVICDQLRRDIAHGVYKPGPIRVRVIAERFGVSATPVREALRRLEAEGLVTVGNRQIVINRLSVDEMREIYTIRAELEAFAVRQAVPSLRGETETLARLEALVERMDVLEHEPESWREANEEFHWILYRAAAMPRLEDIINRLWVAVAPYLRLYVSTARSFRQAQSGHRELLDHVRRGDADAAASLMRKHVSATMQLLADGLVEAGAG